MKKIIILVSIAVLLVLATGCTAKFTIDNQALCGIKAMATSSKGDGDISDEIATLTSAEIKCKAEKSKTSSYTILCWTADGATYDVANDYEYSYPTKGQTVTITATYDTIGTSTWTNLIDSVTD